MKEKNPFIAKPVAKIYLGNLEKETEKKVKFCTDCGEKYRDNDKFCGECGSKRK
jgi:rRNA maturation endonuclease Nob1